MLIDPILEAARAHGGAIALDDGKNAIAYRDLPARIGTIAASLGLERGDRVALLSARGSLSSLGFLGILAAGAACVPLAPGGPIERAKSVLAQARPKLVLHDAPYAASAAKLGIETLAIERALEAGSSAIAPIASQDLAYVLFTSGSTGVPKGVAWDHDPASLFARWAEARVGLGPGDRVAALAPIHFDLATFDLFAALASGASVVIPPYEALLFPRALAEWISARGITVTYAVPSLYVALARTGIALGSLRAAIFAGEPFPVTPLCELARLAPRAVLENWYGPTETNVCTAHRLPRPPRMDDPPLPIGEALPFFEIALSDPDGELVARGEGIMAGYWGEELAPLGIREHATGDLATIDGSTLRLRGRRDRMVKIRGHRVELGEVEHALARVEGVREAAVIEIGGELRAFYAADRDPGARAIRARLGELLPAPMIPTELVRIEALPRTATGKVALSELDRGPRS